MNKKQINVKNKKHKNENVDVKFFLKKQFWMQISNNSFFFVNFFCTFLKHVKNVQQNDTF